MNTNLKYYLGIVLAALLFVGGNAFYVVGQAEQAIVLQFGEPVRLVKEPGLKLKVPFIQNVVLYDTRLLNLDPPAQEVVLNDKKRLDVDSFTRYKIVDPARSVKQYDPVQQCFRLFIQLFQLYKVLNNGSDSVPGLLIQIFGQQIVWLPIFTVLRRNTFYLPQRFPYGHVIYYDISG